MVANPNFNQSPSKDNPPLAETMEAFYAYRAVAEKLLLKENPNASSFIDIHLAGLNTMVSDKNATPKDLIATFKYATDVLETKMQMSAAATPGVPMPEKPTTRDTKQATKALLEYIRQDTQANMANNLHDGEKENKNKHKLRK